MVRILIVSLYVLGSASMAIAQSKAENWLVAQAVEEGCSGNGGTFTAGIYRRDLDGDGKQDLIIDHAGLVCNGERSMSDYCGMQVCSAEVYLRRGNLLKSSASYLGTVLAISGSNPPTIIFQQHGGSTGQMQWNGRDFSKF